MLDQLIAAEISARIVPTRQVKMIKQQSKTAKSHQNLLFWGSRSFKVIDLGTTVKLVSSACYDKQHACVYLRTFSRQTIINSSNITILWGVPLLF